MPNLANITVKASNGTTDVIYTGLTPGSSNEYSVHKAPALGATDETRPEFRSRVTQTREGWRVTTWYMYPYAVLNSTDGVTTVRRRIMSKKVTDYPKDVPATTIAEAVAQGANLEASTLVKSLATDGSNFI